MPAFRPLLLSLALAMANPAFSADCAKPAEAKAMLAQVTADINGYRQAAGLPALVNDKKLAKSAQAHACDMAGQGQFSHFGSNGSDLVRRLKDVGYRFRSANENIGRFRTAKTASDWWCNSAPHRANMLSPKIDEMGLGVALGADQQLYWVMVGGAAK
ncbi:CAP domain-containing protein [Pseudorhodobacter sp. E13]|uniref:CAP domain-containing protein n=1 Tax=Pseudorhodobacter sp. E13 TaxID=2487931 RepID=UPI000F8C8868|nr:CAP domain-containing protein [Pseudorhodobacter sp. E13]RUS59272.1 CAP domain-containing protein [Pseudorhodobacter sp. E13]